MKKALRFTCLFVALAAYLSLVSHASHHGVSRGDVSSHCRLCHTSSVPAPSTAVAGTPSLHIQEAPAPVEADSHSAVAFFVGLTRAPPTL